MSKTHVVKRKKLKVLLTIASPLGELWRYPVGRHASTVNGTKIFKTFKITEHSPGSIHEMIKVQHDSATLVRDKEHVL